MGMGMWRGCAAVERLENETQQETLSRLNMPLRQGLVDSEGPPASSRPPEYEEAGVAPSGTAVMMITSVGARVGYRLRDFFGHKRGRHVALASNGRSSCVAYWGRLIYADVVSGRQCVDDSGRPWEWRSVELPLTR